LSNLLLQEEYVPNQLNLEVLRRLARLGAQARLEQIETERRAILAAFPDLRARRRGRKPGARTQPPKAGTPAAAKPQRRRKMTPAQRREVSERMKRYWAERRKARGKD
jgi:hypothetical protein